MYEKLGVKRSTFWSSAGLLQFLLLSASVPLFLFLSDAYQSVIKPAGFN